MQSFDVLGLHLIFGNGGDQELPSVGKAVGLKSRQRGLNLGDLRQQTWGHFDRSIPV